MLSGFERRNMGKKYTKEELKKIYTDRKKELQKIPTILEFKQRKAVLRLWGTYNNFVREMGDIPHFNRTKEDYIKWIHMIIKKTGEIPSSNVARDEGMNIENIRQMFGSWNNFLTEAGLELNIKMHRNTLTKDELLTIYINACNESNELISSKEIQKHTKITHWIFMNRFGTYSNLLQEALEDKRLNIKNKKISRREQYTKEELEDILKKYLNTTPKPRKKSFIEYIKLNNTASFTTFINRFQATSFKKLIERP